MNIDWNTVIASGIASGIAAFAGGGASYLVSEIFASRSRKQERVHHLLTEWNHERVHEARIVVNNELRDYLASSPEAPDFDKFYDFCRSRGTEKSASIMIQFVRKASELWLNNMLHRREFVVLLGSHMKYWRDLLLPLKPRSGSEWAPAFDALMRVKWR